MKPANALGIRGIVASRLAILGLLTLGSIIWFGNIAVRTLSEPDEARYAEIPREMLASGDWITPHLNGIPYLEKPPLQYWATAIAFAVFGPEPWVSRLWVFTLGLAGVLITYATARALWGERAGAFAALVLASYPLYFIVAHINTLDAGLAFFLNAGLAAFLMSQRSGVPSQSRRLWMRACWIALACGFLQKGLIAVVLPAIALVVYSLWARRFESWRHLYLRDGLLIFAVVTLPWLVAVSVRNPDFLQFFFVHEHFARFTSTVHKRTEPWWFFIAVLAVGVLPWIVPTVRAAWASARRPLAESKSIDAEKLILVWAMAQLVFFSISGSKLAPYIVSMAAPLALLTGHWLDRRGGLENLRPVVAGSCALILIYIALPWIVPYLAVPGPKRSAFAAVADWAQMAGAAGAACLLAYVPIASTHGMRGAMVALAASVSLPLSILMCGTNALRQLRSPPGLAASIAPHLTPNASLYCVGSFWPALTFELRRTCTVVEYRGELELELDPDRTHHIDSVETFLERWKNDSAAVAVVAPRVWNRIALSGTASRTILDEPTAIVMVKP